MTLWALNIDLDPRTLTIAGGSVLIHRSRNTLTALIDNTVVTLTGTQTLTNKTLGATTVEGNIILDTNAAYDLGPR